VPAWNVARRLFPELPRSSNRAGIQRCGALHGAGAVCRVGICRYSPRSGWRNLSRSFPLSFCKAKKVAFVVAVIENSTQRTRPRNASPYLFLPEGCSTGMVTTSDPEREWEISVRSVSMTSSRRKTPGQRLLVVVGIGRGVRSPYGVSPVMT